MSSRADQGQDIPIYDPYFKKEDGRIVNTATRILTKDYIMGMINDRARYFSDELKHKTFGHVWQTIEERVSRGETPTKSEIEKEIVTKCASLCEDSRKEGHKKAQEARELQGLKQLDIKKHSLGRLNTKINRLLFSNLKGISREDKEDLASNIKLNYLKKLKTEGIRYTGGFLGKLFHDHRADFFRKHEEEKKIKGFSELRKNQDEPGFQEYQDDFLDDATLKNAIKEMQEAAALRSDGFRTFYKWDVYGYAQNPEEIAERRMLKERILRSELYRNNEGKWKVRKAKPGEVGSVSARAPLVMHLIWGHTIKEISSSFRKTDGEIREQIARDKKTLLRRANKLKYFLSDPPIDQIKDEKGRPLFYPSDPLYLPVKHGVKQEKQWGELEDRTGQGYFLGSLYKKKKKKEADKKDVRKGGLRSSGWYASLGEKLKQSGLLADRGKLVKRAVENSHNGHDIYYTLCRLERGEYSELENVRLIFRSLTRYRYEKETIKEYLSRGGGIRSRKDPVPFEESSLPIVENGIWKGHIEQLRWARYYHALQSKDWRSFALIGESATPQLTVADESWDYPRYQESHVNNAERRKRDREEEAQEAQNILKSVYTPTPYDEVLEWCVYLEEKPPLWRCKSPTDRRYRVSHSRYSGIVHIPRYIPTKSPSGRWQIIKEHWRYDGLKHAEDKAIAHIERNEWNTASLLIKKGFVSSGETKFVQSPAMRYRNFLEIISK